MEATSTAPSEGLSTAEARALLAAHGPNAIRREEGTSAWRILASQFRGAMIWLLFAACAISAALGEAADAIAIGTIVVLNALVGFVQEHRAERAIAALRAMTAPRARVRRDRRPAIVPADEIVPGDVLLLEAGDLVAADARVLEAHALSVNEAALTGESLPVEKRPGAVADAAPLAERTDRVFLGTAIAAGTAVARVEATGMATELGRIADLLATARTEPTPLERRLERVARMLLVLCVAIAAVIAALELVRGTPWVEVLVSSVSLAVAAVPEGLAAIVTIALAIGVQRMAARNVLVRKLAAVETLGCATVVCTDKTGTLTTGVMTVREIWGKDHRRVLEVAAADCDAELEGARAAGDPTELAILEAAAARAITRSEIERSRPRVAVNPFDAERKRMSILRADGVLYVKGAIDRVLPLCVAGQEGAEEANAEMAARGLRVLAVAIGRSAEERDLELVGLVGIADPPRTEAIEAVRLARGAGIRTVMITGDHPITARAIAIELGIVRDGEDHGGIVHARATPEDKLAIVRAWKDRGEIVAMTGDGVNDAPALREAHIGIAMGKTGTEVARGAASMVLADDDFASIVAAIREGRGIFENVRKTLVYLLTGNFAELGLMLGASLLGMPLPLTALQILWVNLVTDGLPAIALVMDPTAPDVLDRPPRRPEEPIVGAAQWRGIVTRGLLEAAVVVGVFRWALGGHDLEGARSFAFATLVLSEVFRAFAARSETRVYPETGVLTNVRLVAVVVATIVAQLALHQLPVTRELFAIAPMPASDWAIALGAALVPVTLIEVAKLVTRALASTAARRRAR